VARTLKAHLDQLLTYFTYPISNAMSEGFNSKIQSLKHAARGFLPTRRRTTATHQAFQTTAVPR
jgi:transposase